MVQKEPVYAPMSTQILWGAHRCQGLARAKLFRAITRVSHPTLRAGLTDSAYLTHMGAASEITRSDGRVRT
ncbi:hypothetical protein R50076_28190 [Gilvimarinus japonicus]